MNTFFLVALFSLLPGVMQKMPSAADRFIGSWHGSSLCVDRKTDTACKDEEVVYVVKGISGVRDTVEMEAFKIINRERDSMGPIKLAYSRGSDSWTFEFSARGGALWSFQVKDSTLTGTLVELPSKRLIRKVDARRIKE